MSTYKKLKFIYFLAHVGTLVALFIGTWQNWLMAVAIYLAFQVLGVGIGVHRYSAHKSFTTSHLWKIFFLTFGTLATIGSTIAWAGLHRLHHVTSDTDKDPHSPHFLSTHQIVSGSYMEQTNIPARFIRDLVKDDTQKFFHTHYFKIIGSYVLILALFGWQNVIFGYLVPVTFVYWVTAFGIVMNHKWGYRNFNTSDLSVNSWVLSAITLGDGWHNNHHFNPNNPSHSAKWWEFDLCYLIIRGVQVKIK